MSTWKMEVFTVAVYFLLLFWVACTSETEERGEKILLTAVLVSVLLVGAIVAYSDVSLKCENIEVKRPGKIMHNGQLYSVEHTVLTICEVSE